MATVFLTGGSGFVGRRVASLLDAGGHRVAQLVRRGRHESDLLDDGSYVHLMPGADVVVHLAAATGKVQPAEYLRTNVEGTRSILEAANRVGVPRVLFISTIAVKFSETARYFYAESEAKAERLVVGSGLRYTIVRPTMVGGAGSPVITGLARLAGLPLIPAFGGATCRVQPIARDDLAQFLVDLVELDRHDGEMLELGGPETLTLRELLGRMHRRLRQRPPRFVNLPIGAVLRLLRLVERVAYHLSPLTVGQLATFRFDGVAEPNPLWLARRERLLDVDGMLAESLAG